MEDKRIPIKPVGELKDEIQDILKEKQARLAEYKKVVMEGKQLEAEINFHHSRLWNLIGKHYPETLDGHWTVDNEANEITPGKPKSNESPFEQLMRRLQGLEGGE